MFEAAPEQVTKRTDDAYNHKDYTTRHEIIFLKNLGSWGPTERDREKCLKGYIRGARLRDNWGDIDRDQVIGFAKELLRQIKIRT